MKLISSFVSFFPWTVFKYCCYVFNAIKSKKNSSAHLSVITTCKNQTTSNPSSWPKLLRNITLVLCGLRSSIPWSLLPICASSSRARYHIFSPICPMFDTVLFYDLGWINWWQYWEFEYFSWWEFFMHALSYRCAHVVTYIAEKSLIMEYHLPV